MPRDEAAGCGTAFTYGVAGAVIIGFPSFLAGFIGPIIFTRKQTKALCSASLLLGLLALSWDLSRVFCFRSATDENDRATLLVQPREPSNQSMKPTAPFRNKFGVLAITPWISSRRPASLVLFGLRGHALPPYCFSALAVAYLFLVRRSSTR
jgi:hypothetical protein